MYHGWPGVSCISSPLLDALPVVWLPTRIDLKLAVDVLALQTSSSRME